MLDENEISQALHASRVVAVPALNPHGPLGLEHLAAIVNHLRGRPVATECVQRPISLPVETWEKLDQLARAASRSNASPLTASTVAAALLEQAVAVK